VDNQSHTLQIILVSIKLNMMLNYSAIVLLAISR